MFIVNSKSVSHNCNGAIMTPIHFHLRCLILTCHNGNSTPKFHIHIYMFETSETIECESYYLIGKYVYFLYAKLWRDPCCASSTSASVFSWCEQIECLRCLIKKILPASKTSNEFNFISGKKPYCSKYGEYKNFGGSFIENLIVINCK